MLDREVLILKLASVDGLSARAIAFSEVTSLRHETGDHSVELAALVAQRDAAGRRTGSTCRQLGKIVSSFGHRVAIKAKNNATGIIAIDFEIKVDTLGDGLVGVHWSSRVILLIVAIRWDRWHHWVRFYPLKLIKHRIEVEGVGNLIE